MKELLWFWILQDIVLKKFQLFLVFRANSFSHCTLLGVVQVGLILCTAFSWIGNILNNLISWSSKLLLVASWRVYSGAWCTHSYATKGTKRWFSLWTLPGSIFSTHPLLFIRSLQICLWRHPEDLPLPYEGYRWDAWSGILWVYEAVTGSAGFVQRWCGESKKLRLYSFF